MSSYSSALRFQFAGAKLLSLYLFQHGRAPVLRAMRQAKPWFDKVGVKGMVCKPAIECCAFPSEYLWDEMEYQL